MKSYITYIPILACIIACKKPLDDNQLQHINGYWEIKEVKAPDADPKEYTANTVVDYFEIKDRNGFRQKVSPQLDGTFQTNTIQEKVQIIDSIGKTFIKYQTTYAKWVEELVELDENNMTIINENDIKYFYQRFQPLKID